MLEYGLSNSNEMGYAESLGEGNHGGSDRDILDWENSLHNKNYALEADSNA
jgi:hypothetical protein